MSTANKVSWGEWIRERDDPTTAAGKPEALEDIVVLDLSHKSMAGVICSAFLAEFGARVIRVEPPGGDTARFFSPFGLEHEGTGLGYLVEGRNKLHITLDLTREGGRAILKELAGHADVIVETHKPGQMDSWGVGYRQLREINPRLIYVAHSTYGQFGPEAKRQSNKPDYEVADQALSGILHVTGEMPTGEEPKPWEVPTKAGNWFGWYASGAWGAFASLAALHHRELSGKGQMIDITGSEAIMRFMEDMILWYEKAGVERGRIGLLDTSVFPYTFVRCKDGFTMIAGFSDVNFQALTTIMGRPELRQDPRFKGFIDRLQMENKIALHSIVEAWSQNYTADEILGMVHDYVLNKRGPGIVATGRVNSPTQTLNEEHWWKRGAFEKVDDPVYGELTMQGTPWKMTETPPRTKWVCRPVGADNEFVYLNYLGYGRDRMAALKEQGIL
ncbi:MAG: CoA transferase [Chloroflexi bacterium]|nr:CoA transferase [Chloroflexota bacterium]